jgi:hypothetical protein
LKRWKQRFFHKNFAVAGVKKAKAGDATPVKKA